MYSIVYTGQFKKSLKLCVKRGLDATVLTNAVTILQENGSLPDSYKPHKLKGKYIGCWECHLQPDWLLIWRQNDLELELILVDTGTHSDLFKTHLKILRFAQNDRAAHPFTTQNETPSKV